MCMSVCVEFGGQHGMYSLITPPFYFVRQSFSLNLMLTDAVASEIQERPCLHSPSLRLQISAAIPSFYVGADDLNSGPHACLADTFPVEPCSQPQLYFLREIQSSLRQDYT